MIEKLDEIKKAKAQIVEGSLTIWNARLEALERVGDIKGVLDHMISPTEAGWFDNCDCNRGCGGGSEAILPQEISAAKKR